MAYFVVRVFALSGAHDVAALRGRCNVPCWRSLGGAEVKTRSRLYARRAKRFAQGCAIKRKILPQHDAPLRIAVSLPPSMFVMLQQIAKFQEVPVSTIVREAVESYLAKG